MDALFPDAESCRKYRGEWVILCDNKVVAHGKNLQKIWPHTAHCKRTPTITKIPKHDVLLY